MCVCRSLPCQLTLKYVNERKEKHVDLSRAFTAHRALQLVGTLRAVTITLLAFNVIFIAYDALQYGSSTLQTSIWLRLAVVLPACLGIVAFTYTTLYLRHPSLLCVPALVLGAAVIAYSVASRDPGYGTLAVLIAYLYWYVRYSCTCGLGITSHPTAAHLTRG